MPSRRRAVVHCRRHARVVLTAAAGEPWRSRVHCGEFFHSPRQRTKPGAAVPQRASSQSVGVLLPDVNRCGTLARRSV